MDQALIDETVQAAAQLLTDKGWTVEPPPGDYWSPAFTPTFYEAGGDAEGEVYCRVDLPEGLYYALQDAARLGVETLQGRLSAFQKTERDVADLERNTPPHKQIFPRKVGVMDGVELSSMELRGMTSFLGKQVDHWKKALDRADTRKHKT